MKSKRWVSESEKNSLSPRRWQNFRFHDPNHCAERAEEGRSLEVRIESILVLKKELGEIGDFIRHLPNSPEDLDGKDFTVTSRVGRLVSFGVTCSFTSYKKYFRNHPGQDCLWITSGYGDKEIWLMIQDLTTRPEDS